MPPVRGQGQIIRNPCKGCLGTGKAKVRKKIQVKAPPGVDNGSRLRLRGEGKKGSSAANGDLYIFIHVTPHEFFERDGDDIYARYHLHHAGHTWRQHQTSRHSRNRDSEVPKGTRAARSSASKAKVSSI